MDHFDALRAYVRLVELGSFTAVANEQQVTQPTVSKWIAALEDELGVQLLDRTTRGVRVTTAGEAFHQRALEVLETWEQAVGATRGQHAKPQGRLRVSVPVVFGDRFVAPLMPAFLSEHPAIELDLRFSDAYVDLVSDGIDVAIRVGRPVDSSYRARVLADTPRRLVASPAFIEAHGAPESLAALAKLPCLLHSGLGTNQTWELAEGDGKPTSVSVSGRVSANHSATLAQLAIAGHGVALLASWLVDDALADGRLVRLLPDHEPPRAPIQALMASTRHVPSRVRAFVDHLAQGLTDLA